MIWESKNKNKTKKQTQWYFEVKAAASVSIHIVQNTAVRYSERVVKIFRGMMYVQHTVKMSMVNTYR